MVTVCVFVFFVRLPISPPRINSGVKFCRAVHRRPRQGISHFCELCSPESQNRTNWPARHHLHDVHNDYPLAPGHIVARRLDVGSACADIMSVPEDGRTCWIGLFLNSDRPHFGGHSPQTLKQFEY